MADEDDDEGGRPGRVDDDEGVGFDEGAEGDKAGGGDVAVDGKLDEDAACGIAGFDEGSAVIVA